MARGRRLRKPRQAFKSGDLSKAGLQPSRSQLAKPPLCKQAQNMVPRLLQVIEECWDGEDVYLGNCAMIAQRRTAELFMEGMRTYLGSTVAYWEQGKTKQQVLDAVRAAREAGK